MLGHTWRFGVKNDTGVQIDTGKATIKSRMWKGSSDGTVAFQGSEGSIYSNSANITDGSYLAEDTYDNSSNEYEGGDFELSVTFDSGDTPSGDVLVYFERSTDGGTTWPDDGANGDNEDNAHLVCVMSITETAGLGTAGEVYVKPFEL
ncbi:MAG: hypothetical protein JSU86_07580 [Phycisphaerales bacterium]|nr:MAG: hypothetical protein JSU86_07580 [Phycisphaerales bacterium]